MVLGMCRDPGYYAVVATLLQSVPYIARAEPGISLSLLTKVIVADP